MVGVGCHVYVANSNEGIGALEISGLPGCGAPAPPPNATPISFAAFCTTEDSFDEDDVTITDVLYKNDDPDEPVSIAWTSQTTLSTVVLKAGPSMYNYAGGTSGGAASEEGTPAGTDQSPTSPCPDGEDLILKNEDVGDKGEED